MKVSVGLMEGRNVIRVELQGRFVDEHGSPVAAASREIRSETTLISADPQSSFTLDDVTIGIGFHWERKERQSFRGDLRVVRRGGGLTAVNDVDLEDYVTSVISSEMSASCPSELLKAHAVISRSWLRYPKERSQPSGAGNTVIRRPGERIRWYGREAHAAFDVCADDHCQRYQGITKAFSPAAEAAVRATAGEMLTYGGEVCDARFYKCCGGFTENYAAAWDDRDIPYLISVYDGPGARPAISGDAWYFQSPPAYCNTGDTTLLSQILPNFDQETRDFYRWRVDYESDQLDELVHNRLGVDLGHIHDLIPLSRGASGRIYRLRIVGSRDSLVIGKELEIRRALSKSHLYSSAFTVVPNATGFTLRGAGWGHGVGLCQIGAAVMASRGISYDAILKHYYPGTETARK